MKVEKERLITGGIEGYVITKQSKEREVTEWRTKG